MPSTSASQSSFQVIPTPAIQGLPCGETQTLAPPEIAAAHLSPGTQVVLSLGGGASFKFPCLRRGLVIGMPSLNIEVWRGERSVCAVPILPPPTCPTSAPTPGFWRQLATLHQISQDFHPPATGNTFTRSALRGSEWLSLKKI